MFTFKQPEKATKPATTKAAKPTKQTKTYQITALTPEWFNGEQRRIVYKAAVEHDGQFTAASLVKACDAAGLKSKTPTIESVAYHLHQLAMLGYVIEVK